MTDYPIVAEGAYNIMLGPLELGVKGRAFEELTILVFGPYSVRWPKRYITSFKLDLTLVRTQKIRLEINLVDNLVSKFPKHRPS